jgi:hypothetical protein
VLGAHPALILLIGVVWALLRRAGATRVHVGPAVRAGAGTGTGTGTGTGQRR